MTDLGLPNARWDTPNAGSHKETLRERLYPIGDVTYFGL